MSLSTNITNLATRIATEFKTAYGRIGTLPSLTTSTKSDLVSAINEVKASVSGAAGINDASTSTSSTWSSQKVSDQITAALAALVNGAPAALDTLKEIADQLAADEAGAAAMQAAINNRVRYDAAQSLTAPQKAQALSNIGAQDAASVGDTARDFVADFNAALL